MKEGEPKGRGGIRAEPPERDSEPTERRKAPRVKDHERSGRGAAAALSRFKMLERKILGRRGG